MVQLKFTVYSLTILWKLDQAYSCPTLKSFAICKILTKDKNSLPNRHLVTADWLSWLLKVANLKLKQTKVLRYFWERKEIFSSPSIDHSFFLALKYISRVVSFVSTWQVWLRFLEEGSSPLNFNGWAVTFWLVSSDLISPKVHSADSLAWVGNAERRRKFKIDSVRAGRKSILRIVTWTILSLLLLPRLLASCSKSDRSFVCVYQTNSTASEKKLKSRNSRRWIWLHYLIICKHSLSIYLLVNGSCWQTNATGKFTEFQMNIYNQGHSFRRPFFKRTRR